MPIYPKIARNLLLPLGDKVMRTSISKQLRFLVKSQWWTLEELIEYQNKSIRALIRYAYENVPYYHKVFRKRGLYSDDIKITKDLVKLPILTKEIIRKNYNEILSKNFKKWKPVESKTGGTTGKTLRYITTKNSKSISWAASYRAWGWACYKYGDKKATLAGSSLFPDEKIPFSKKIRFAIERNLTSSAVHLSDSIIADYIKRLEKFQPKFLRGYPSSIFSLAKYISENNTTSIKPTAIFVTAEILYPHQRDLIEKIFNSKVFNHYSNPESRADGYECKEHNGLHMTTEASIMEFVDIENNECVSPGECSEIVTTNLFNYAMPFIRYSTEDIGIPSDDKCSCGRGLPLMKSLEGRTTDIITFNNGITLGGPPLTLIFKEFNIVEYQLVQEKRDLLVIKIVKDKNYSNIETEHILNIMKYHCGEGVDIKIEFFNEIPRAINSKYRFIISKIT